MCLVKNGWPPEVAMDMSDKYRKGFCIILGQANGAEYDWENDKFKEPAKGPGK